MLVNYNKLKWLDDQSGEVFGYENVNIVGLYQIPNLAIYLYIDTETHTVLTVEFDYEDQPELLEKDIPRDTAEHVYEWLRSEDIIYGEL
ncbi:hypothetical protein ACWEXK_12275 [Staphylococcus xylosus]|uniref:hypothetical protein n=1 Tax=Staphylococcus xylosus TaxID=1288 RepID=UPI000D1D69B9|nr:hypothetical protein [Staphylococcus xylosus]PTI25710.1 hypothetical protein BU115_06605 [Staphylococcus xylosus]